MPDKRTAQNVTPMKKTAKKPPVTSPKRVSAGASRSGVKRVRDEMRSHYDFDYSTSRQNRFAERFSEGALVVVLDPDVASIFQSAEAVNSFLRSAISAMPSTEPRKRKRAS